MKLFVYFHWDGEKFNAKGTLRAADDDAAFEAACKKLKLFHRGNIAVQEVSKQTH